MIAEEGMRSMPKIEPARRGKRRALPPTRQRTMERERMARLEVVVMECSMMGIVWMVRTFVTFKVTLNLI
jgi:hypothetical protein